MLKENLAEINRNIKTACVKSNRPANSITLIAVSKNQPPQRVIEAQELGINDFSENKIQEALPKIETVNILLPNNKIIWHFIGRLQSNKVKKIVSLFEYIHSLDSVALAKLIDKEAEKINKKQKVLLQVNVAGEITKTGFSEGELKEKIAWLLELNHIVITGVMTIAPISDDPESSRQIFRKLRALGGLLEKKHSISLPELSMGMSQDYVVAVEEGATMVRLGTALFGK
jgi:pyridoxal phosphate enzyme (YggS family)